MSKFCPECGTPANGGRFCAECGFRFTGSENGNGSGSGNGNGNGSSVAATPAPPAAYAQPNRGSFNNGSNTSASRWQANGSFNNSNNASDRSSIGAAWAQAPSPAQMANAAAAAAPLVNHAASYATHKSPYQQQPPPPPPPAPPAPALAAAAPPPPPPPSVPGQWRQTPYQPASSLPVATPVRSASSSASAGAAYGAAGYGGANNYGGADPLLHKPPAYLTATPAPEPVPTAATGAEAQQVYETCVQTMRASRGGANEDGVKAFKQNCRLYGLKQLDVVGFYDSLVRELGPDATLAFVPTLARLVPDDDRRRELVEFNASKRPTAMATATQLMPSPHAGNASFMTRSGSSSSSDSFRDRSSSASSNGGAAAKKGILNGRYADHPNCDICHVSFDVSKRRHQCRYCGAAVCSSCSPLRLLIPPGKEITGAKGYIPSEPQRVCIQCAPQLHQFQDELVAQFAKSNEDNIYEARGRLVRVPFSNSLFKECQNAADIIGNFFRDDWGAAADRSIPVAFLEKAHGLAIMTILKAGFMVTGQIGTGLVVAKLPDGTWSAPSAIGVGGLGGGFEIGGELIELMIILGSEGAVKVFHKPQANIGAGLDLAVGPYGRSAVAAAAVSASGLNANYSYSQSKGFFAGISLQGKVIVPRNDLNRKFYGRDLQPSEILSGHVAAPNAARPLYEAIQNAMQGVELHRDTLARRASIMGPCRLCNCPMFLAHTHQVWNKNCKTCKHVH